MQRKDHSSPRVFFTFGVGISVLVGVLVAVNVTVRSMAGTGVRPWETFQESAGTQAEGLTIMRKTGCFLCHRIDDFGGEIGPRLNGVKDRKTREELFAWIHSPHRIKPNTIMPEFHLPDDQILKIISYLETK